MRRGEVGTPEAFSSRISSEERASWHDRSRVLPGACAVGAMYQRKKERLLCGFFRVGGSSGLKILSIQRMEIG
jgi:hypothetical protein